MAAIPMASKIGIVPCLLRWKIFASRRSSQRHVLSQCMKHCRAAILRRRFSCLVEAARANSRRRMASQHANAMIQRQNRRALRYALRIWHKNVRVHASLRHWWLRASASAFKPHSSEKQNERYSRQCAGAFGTWITRNYARRWFSRWVI